MDEDRGPDRSGPADYADLRPGSPLRADALVERALAEAAARRQGEAAAAALDALDPAMRPAFEAMLRLTGALAAEIELLRQRLDAVERGRADLVRLDPLRLIPTHRRLAPEAPPPARLVLEADSPDLVGFGWHPPEGEGEARCRWSGAGPCASLRVPGLGAGRLRLTLALRAPLETGVAALDDALVLLNAEPLDFAPAGPPGRNADFAAGIVVPEELAAAPLALVIRAPTVEVAGRRIGPGLRRLVIERIDDGIP